MAAIESGALLRIKDKGHLSHPEGRLCWAVHAEYHCTARQNHEIVSLNTRLGSLPHW